MAAALRVILPAHQSLGLKGSNRMDNSSFGTATAPTTESQSQTIGGQPQGADQQIAASNLERSVKNGAGWFYWIAGLTLVNTVMALSGSDSGFVLGLMFTLMVDAFARDIGSVGPILAIVIDVLAAGFFIFLGVFGNKFHKWAFIVGMIVYVLDTALVILGQSWLALAIHVFALWNIFHGYRSIQKLRDLKDFGVMPNA
jgi:hypothetical protein